MVLLTTSRSPRQLETFFESGEGVGPGHNDEERWGDASVTSTGAAVDLQKRPPLTRWKTKFVTPGPGKYDLRRAASESSIDKPSKAIPLASGVPFRSNRERISKDNYKEPLLVPGSSEYLPSSIIDNPGPGQYDVAQNLGKAQPAPPAPPSDGIQGKTLVLSQSAPSFPPLRNPEDVRYTGRDEDTLCPGDYEYGSHSSMYTVLRQNGYSVDFHASTSQRRFLPKPVSYENTYGFQSNPAAPGLYELRTKLTKGTSQPFASKDPQCGSAQPYKSKSCSTALTPGPGSYPREEEGKRPVDQHFQKSVVLSQSSGPEVAEEKQDGDAPLSFPGYRSKVTREGLFRPAMTQPYTDSDNLLVPGPGHYPKPASIFKHARSRRARSVVEGLQKRFLGVHTPQHQKSLRDSDALALCGFASRQPRGCMVADKTHLVAEPGTYNPNQSLGQSIQAGLKERAKVAKQGVFGSTKDGDRFFGFPLNGKKDGPAPGEHSVETAESGLQTGVDPSGGAFRSKGPRLPPEVSLAKPLFPGPGHYSGDENPAGLSGSASSASSKSPAFRRPKTDRLSFGSCQSRFGAVKDVASDGPCPGDYVTHRGARPSKRVCGAAKTSQNRGLAAPQRRSEPKLDTGLGPGQYDVGGTMADTSRKTFNRTAESAAAEFHEAANRSGRLPAQSRLGGTLLQASDTYLQPDPRFSIEAGARSHLATVEESPEA